MLFFRSFVTCHKKAKFHVGASQNYCVSHLSLRRSDGKCLVGQTNLTWGQVHRRTHLRSSVGTAVLYVLMHSKRQVHSVVLFTFEKSEIVKWCRLPALLPLNENLRSSVPPPIVRSELGGSWRRLSEKQNISCKLRFVKSKSQSAFQLFVLSLFPVLRVKIWSWNWNNQKKIAIQKKWSTWKNLENTYRKNSINMSK